MVRVTRVACAAMIGMTAVAASSGASALTLLVTSTSAFAGDSLAQFGSSDPLHVSISDTNGTASAAAVADLPSGHLGASAANGASGIAQVDMIMNVSDVQPTDYVLIVATLSGSFIQGSGNLYVRTNFDEAGYATGAISCSTYNQVNLGVDCRSQAVPGGPITNANHLMLLLDGSTLSGISTLELQWELDVGAVLPGSSADFLDSGDFTVSVPQGTTLSGNPGGTLIQIVPEPEPASLMAIGVASLLLARSRQRAKQTGRVGSRRLSG